MRRFLVAFSLLLATAAPGGATPGQRSAPDHLVKLAANTCSQDGQFVCNQACDQLSLCTANDQGGFDELPLESCPAGTRCSAELHRCVDRPSACGASTDGGISCHTTGYFPDPLNCSVYHVCLEEGAVSTPKVCAPGSAYNAFLARCSYSTTDSVCTDGRIEPCIREGQDGVVADNPTFYYVCINNNNVLVPDLYRCGDELVYDPETHGCVY